MAGSIKKEGSSWYYVVTLGRKPNGKPNQKKKRGFRTKKEAEKALQEIVYEYNRGTYIEPSTMFYSELLKIWLEQKERTVQRTTYLSYKIITDKHIIPALGKLQISKIKPLLIHEFYNKLYRDSNLSGTSVQKIHMIIKDSLKYAIKMELIAKNPAESVDRPKREQVEIKVWNIEEIKRFLNESKRSQDSLYIAYHLALTSGMRQGEILGLRWKDIDFEKKRLMIKQTLSNDGKELKPGAKTKSGKRVVPLIEPTIQELSLHRERVTREKEEAGAIYVDNDLVVCTSIGTPINPSNLRRSFNRQIDNSNLKKIRFHDLRHSHATMLLEMNVNPKVVSERLGHSNTRITLDTYSHILPTMQSELVNKINQVLYE